MTPDPKWQMQSKVRRSGQWEGLRVTKAGGVERSASETRPRRFCDVGMGYPRDYFRMQLLEISGADQRQLVTPLPSLTAGGKGEMPRFFEEGTLPSASLPRPTPSPTPSSTPTAVVVANYWPGAGVVEHLALET